MEKPLNKQLHKLFTLYIFGMNTFRQLDKHTWANQQLHKPDWQSEEITWERPA